MSLKIIERQIFAQRAREAEKAKATPVAEGLAAALQAEINRGVEQALASHQEALRRAQPPRPVPSPPPDLEARIAALESRLQAPQIHHLSVERDAAGLIRAVNIAGGQRLLVQRNAEGFIAAMAPADTTAPVTYNGRPVRPAQINRR